MHERRNFLQTFRWAGFVLFFGFFVRLIIFSSSSMISKSSRLCFFLWICFVSVFLGSFLAPLASFSSGVTFSIAFATSLTIPLVDSTLDSSWIRICTLVDWTWLTPGWCSILMLCYPVKLCWIHCIRFMKDAIE